MKRAADRPLGIAFLVNEFPAISQPFVLYQIAGMVQQGHDVHIFATERVEHEKIHPLVQDHKLLERTTFAPQVPRGVLRRVSSGAAEVMRRGGLGCMASLTWAARGWPWGPAPLSLRPLYRALGFLPRGSFDIIHCQFGALGPVALQMRRAGLISGRLVTSFRGYDATQYARERPGFYDKLFREGDLFMAVSQSLIQCITDLGCPAHRTRLLYSGIEVGRFPYRVRTLEPGAALRVLTVARLVEKKGVEYGIRAVAELHRGGVPVHYTIVGEGPLRESLASLVRELGIAACVEFAGWRNHDEVTALMDQAHVLLAPSITAASGDQEGIPNVAKEAMAAGMPVVATYHSGIPELVEHGKSGWLAPERDVEGLLQGLRKLASEPALMAAFGRSARAKVEADFDIEQLNRRLSDLYREVL